MEGVASLGLEFGGGSCLCARYYEQSEINSKSGGKHLQVCKKTETYEEFDILEEQ